MKGLLIIPISITLYYTIMINPNLTLFSLSNEWVNNIITSEYYLITR